MLAHIPHALIYAGFVLLTPVILGLALYFFADDHPRSDEPPDSDDERPPGPAALPIAA
jgi:hypothetical protein